MKTKIRITKEFRFEMAHSLPNHKGLCKNIHGHSYTLSVTIIGEPNPKQDQADAGMVMDFGDLKTIVKGSIINKFDHALVIHKDVANSLMDELKHNFDKIIPVDYQPTSELLLIDFANSIISQIPNNVKLFSLKLRETATSVAEWYSDDN
ncbi:MAG: 6-carboxytetrahydropterin synthase QueD [Bacteroidetes bacterium HGW-Bacteroidetes-17]|jgi:6-pyruvoyltetrahydropterin/6-carboxytetrahydropterin synthase|nr:MAG: 6-carboxytetrahydropterin synthase QueD [Bacteroidetes bacterium HGW-Bacteroidetes-17]